MLRASFNKDWTASEVLPFMYTKPGGIPVTLPYDYLLHFKRSAEAPAGSAKGYYPDSLCAMSKKFIVPDEWRDKHILLEFEGVQSDSSVFINGDYAGGCPYGYTKFIIDMNDLLQYGQTNEVSVIARTTSNSRWYTGLGIYRDVNLLVSSLQHITPDGHKITTSEIDGLGAVVEIATEIENTAHNRSTLLVKTSVLDALGNTVVEGSEPVTVNAGCSQILRQRMYVTSPKLWDAESPYLYTCVTTVTLDGAEADRAQCDFGIRRLQLDVRNGLRVNGKTVKLRGACVHHDNGVIGAAAIARAEERRVELLKQAGFNAVRSAHNPISGAFLAACDKHGLYVMDELTDIWAKGKTAYDYSSAFPYHWEQAAEAMVAKDYNHPSVIMYSIGNEISEVGSPAGTVAGRRIADKIKSLDATRYTINSVSLVLASIGRMPMPQKTQQSDINNTLTNFEAMMEQIKKSDFPIVITQETFASVDIAGYNYETQRYLPDKEKFPNRVICGSETFPKNIAENWTVITGCSHVIGDFTWTGWDYIGEAAIGRVRYHEKKQYNVYGEYPWYIAYCGDFDIIGDRRPVSYFREIVFGLRSEPYIAVWYPHTHDLNVVPGKWDFMDGISSWTWNGYEGKPVTVEAYAPGDRVVLYCNGQKAGEALLAGFKAVIETVYTPGKLEAVVLKDNMEIGRTCLQTAARASRLDVQPDRDVIEANDRDLVYISIALTDEHGNLNNMADRSVTVTVQGAGMLAGLGSAKPDSEESFVSGTFRTYNGKALAVDPSGGKG